MVETLDLAVPRVVMMSIGDLADRDGVSKPAVSMAVKRLVEQHGLRVERDVRGRVAGVDVAQYDMLRERIGDPSKDQRPPRDEVVRINPAETYDEALRKKTWYEAHRKGIELAEQMRQLVRVEEVVAAAGECAAAITGIIRRLQNETDALAATVARDGSHGLRVALKAIETRILGEIADALASLPATLGAPQSIEDATTE